MRVKLSGMAGLAALLMTAAMPAQANVDDAVARALALEKGGDMAGAYTVLKPLLATRAGDADYDYAFGVAATDSGHVAEAILAFQRVLAVQPGNAQARAEIARAYARLGDVQSARAQFDTVLDDPSLPDPVRQRFTRIVRDLDRVENGGATDVSAFLDVSGGYDSNINSATGLTSLTLPLLAFLGPASLTGPATRQDSAFLAASGGASIRTPLSPHLAGFASVLGDTRNNARATAFDQATLTGTFGFGYTTAHRDVISVSGQAQQFWLGGDGYRAAYGATAQYTHRLDAGAAMVVAAQWFRLDYRTDPLRDADRYALSVSHVGRTLVATLSGGKEQTRQAAGDNLSNAFVGARVGLEKPLSARFAIVASGAVEGRWHDADDPLFLMRRRDVQLDASLGLKRLLTRAIYVRPQVAYTRNVSNIALYDTSRFIASVGLHADF